MDSDNQIVQIVNELSAEICDVFKRRLESRPAHESFPFVLATLANVIAAFIVSNVKPEHDYNVLARAQIEQILRLREIRQIKTTTLQ